LGDSELVAGRGHYLVRRHLGGSQQLEYASPDRVAQDVEGVHSSPVV
jgi:hypothetical protein